MIKLFYFLFFFSNFVNGNDGQPQVVLFERAVIKPPGLIKV